jgi:hypothetical protein
MVGVLAPKIAVRLVALALAEAVAVPRERTQVDHGGDMIRKLTSGEYRLYSRKPDPKTGRRRNLGTFTSLAAAEKHEREVQYFKRH